MILSEHIIESDTAEVTICPLGDIQWAGDERDLAYDHLREHIGYCLTLPNPRFVGPGDYIDFASPSNREALRGARLYDTARKVIADATKGLVDQLHKDVLAPTAGKWIAMVNGHHHFPTKEDGDSDEYLAHLLGSPFAPDLVYGRIKWVNPRTGKTAGLVKYVVFHGDGNSVFPWGPLTKLYRLAPNWNADIMMMGHQTKKAMGEFDRMDWPDDGGPDRLEHKTVHLVGTGGWTKGYVPGRVTYISSAALPPVALGAPIIHVRPRFRTSTSTGVTLWDPRITVEG